MIPNNLGDLWRDNYISYKNNLAFDNGTESWSYETLENCSNFICAEIEKYGLGEGDVIGILHTKQFEQYAAMLACLKMGIIYSNIDPNSPLERFSKILDTCSPKLIISEKTISDEVELFLNKKSTQILFIGKFKPSVVKISEKTNKLLPLSWDTTAYIMFTSGSTGAPKGVTITHGGLISFINWSKNHFNIDSNDRFAQLSPMFFDNSVFDFYSCLFSGACLVPVDDSLMSKPHLITKFVDNLKCTIWFSVPSLIVYLLSTRVLKPSSLKYIRCIIFGGEGFPKSLLKKLFTYFGKTKRLVNVYGPTEGTCICSSHDISISDFDDMLKFASLGKINPNFKFMIIDENSEAVDIGEKGELCLMGPNISPGYYNDWEKTHACFVQNPKNNCYNEIMYRTGDIVFEEDGLLWFSGRVDNQIKHMGYRIELEEIETVLNSFCEILQAGVIYYKNRQEFGHIVAVIQVVTKISELEVRQKLANYLPKYMIPREIIFSLALPKNKNGKVDRIILLDNYVQSLKK